MPVSPVPPPAHADSTGQPDSQWIGDVRDALEDFPVWTGPEPWTADGTNGIASATAQPLKINFPKINGSSAANDNTPLVQDITAAQSFVVVDYPTAPGANQVQINYDTGELVFQVPPTSGHTIQVTYQTCKWRDKSILTALMDVLREMFPSCGHLNVDESIQIVVNQWDYQMPAWMASPGSRLIDLEINDLGNPVEPYRPAPPGESRIGWSKLHLPWAQNYGPTAILRLTGWGPYLRLGDLESQLYHLPIYHALGVLLPKKETKRIREDTVVPLAQVGGAQPTLNMQTGDYWERRFRASLANMKRLTGPASKRPWPSRYQRMNYAGVGRRGF